MRSLVAAGVLFLVGEVLGAVNEPCIGKGGAPGVCVSTAACTNGGGESITGACPSDPDGVRCCTKPKCGQAGDGNCRWQSDCAGTSVSNQCPGPSQMKCCLSPADGFGGYSPPKLPAVGDCQAVAVSGAEKIIAAFPGRVREVFCTRACECGKDPSDHCCGKATDMMCSDGGGVPSMSGREIAEWCMNNRDALNLKYVIWGQRIWSTDRDQVAPWTNWRGMEDRGDITQNHWDHVHVSYN